MTRRLLLLLFLLPFAFVLPASAQVGSFQQWCQAGDIFANVSGIASANPLQGSFPKCQVSVVITGTITPAVLYSTITLTPLANPFCANLDGSFLLFASTGVQYDITMSNSNACNPAASGFAQLPAPFTFFDVPLGGGGGGGGSGTIIPCSQYGMPYYSLPGTATSINCVPAPISPASVPQLFISTPLGGSATLGVWSPAGILGRVVSGTTDTIRSTDCDPNRVIYNGTAAVAVTLPTATTLLVPNCVFRLTNKTSGPGGDLTVTPATWTCNGVATCTIHVGQMGTFYVDPSGTNWSVDIGDASGNASGTVTGSGTTNIISKWISASVLGNSQMTDDGTHAVASGDGYGLKTNGGITFDKVNDTGTGTTASLFVCKSGTAGSVVTCPLSTTTGVLGVAVAGVGTTPGTSGSTSVCYSGICSVIMDNTSVIGDYCIPSAITAGQCHDTGATTPTAGVISFFVLSVATAGNPAGVEVLTPDWYAQNSCATCVTAANPATAANKIVVSAGASRAAAYIDFPDVKIVPAANCNNATAGNGWSIPASNAPTVACRVGTNNLGGELQWANNNTTTNAQFTFELPGDWDTTSQPFIKIIYGSGANTSGTVKWTFSSACTKGDGTITDDPAFVAESATAGKTMAVANRMWAESVQFTAMTSGNNCIAGSTVIIKVTSGNGTAASAVNVYQATVTVPRLPTVQAN